MTETKHPNESEKKESMDSFKHYNNQPTSLLSIDLLKDRLMTSEKFCHLKESWVSNNSEKPSVKIEPKSKKVKEKKKRTLKMVRIPAKIVTRLQLLKKCFQRFYGAKCVSYHIFPFLEFAEEKESYCKEYVEQQAKFFNHS